MNIEDLRQFCLNLPGVTEHTPFDEVTLVYKVMGKMFALIPTDHELSITLKSDPEWSAELREQYTAISGAYHMNKTLWNTIMMNGSVSNDLTCSMINHSYNLVVAKLTLKAKHQLQLIKNEKS